MIQPYYQSDNVTLYCGDCLEILPHLPTGIADLLLTDPPYGIDYHSSAKKLLRQITIAGDSSEAIGLKGIGMGLKVLRKNRHFYLFGRWDLSSYMVGGVCELVWAQGGGHRPLTAPWANGHEYITFGMSLYGPSQKARGTGNGLARLRRSSVLTCQRVTGQGVRLHPTQKPVPLLRELIEASSHIGELVLDPFAGVGSTLIAALLEGRQAIGIEIDEGYCAIAERRIREAEAQLPMFAGVAM